MRFTIILLDDKNGDDYLLVVEKKKAIIIDIISFCYIYITGFFEGGCQMWMTHASLGFPFHVALI